MRVLLVALTLAAADPDVDVRDILAGVDAMVERGIAVPERLAVGPRGRAAASSTR